MIWWSVISEKIQQLLIYLFSSHKCWIDFVGVKVRKKIVLLFWREIVNLGLTVDIVFLLGY